MLKNKKPLCRLYLLFYTEVNLNNIFFIKIYFFTDKAIANRSKTAANPIKPRDAIPVIGFTIIREITAIIMLITERPISGLIKLFISLTSLYLFYATL